MPPSLLGDPHQGRQFVHGVPLARLGERELLSFQQFKASIMTPGSTLHVNMGDLFDKATVSYVTIVDVADAYLEAAEENPDTIYVVMKGNHDWQRDLTRPSAFDIFAKIVAVAQNIIVVTTWAAVGEYVFFAWHPTITPAEMVNEIQDGMFLAAFGHWDIMDLGETLNLIPTQALGAKRIRNAYTGHIHLPQAFVRDNVNVFVVGSMQPFAHGEELDEDLYVTRTLATLGDEDYTNKCLRVELAPGEVWDQEVNCLQLTIKRIKEAADDIPDVTMGDFDLDGLFGTAFKNAGVSPGVQELVLAQYNVRRLGGVS